ncbi:BTAD domain-containing putative transcriptional regulator [Thermoflexus hugenholtzii]
MALDDRIARSRLIPPRPRPTWVRRPRVEARLREALETPVVVVKAEPGYGKSTAVAQTLHHGPWPYLWYSLTEADRDPQRFLAHWIYAFRSLDPRLGRSAAERLHEPGGFAALDALANELVDSLSRETVLVLDDYHLADSSEIRALLERWLEQIPPALHLVLITRHDPELRGSARARAHGELREITTADLAFTPEEVQELFAAQGLPLSPEAARRLAEETEGWIIALWMILHHLRESGPQAMEALLDRLPEALSDLFAYLAEEVLTRQPEPVQRFLLRTSILHELSPEICAALLEDPEAGRLLPSLERRGLFLISAGEGRWRYHHLFQEFLQRQAQLRLGDLRPLHRQAADCYRQRGELEAAIVHLLMAGAFEEAADQLEALADRMIRQGRYLRLAEWVDRLPDSVLRAHPRLRIARADAARLLSRFDEALTGYAQARDEAARRSDAAAEVQALIGQAMVFLDTVQPARAAPLLREAWRRTRSHPGERIRLLGLMAENLLNAGRLRRADLLLERVRRQDPSALFPDVEPRLRIRQGRLAQARLLVEGLLQTAPWGPERQRIPRSHREATVLLAWICAMTGEGEAARRYAEHGLRVGRELRSPIVECVALARLGHGWLSGPDYDLRRAEEAYRASLEVARQIRVPRFEAEAHLGLTRVEGMKGRPGLAYAHAEKGLQILQEAGDAYLAAAMRLAQGIAAVQNEDPRGPSWLEEAIQMGIGCGERYLCTLGRLWRAWAWLRQGDPEAARPCLEEALRVVQAEGYDFMLTGTPFLGFHDVGSRMTLLQAALSAGLFPVYLQHLFPQVLQTAASAVPFGPWTVPEGSRGRHPPLYVQTLGPFRVWRGLYEIPPEAWERKPARRLLQFLIAHRRRPVHREEVMEALWPGRDPSSAALELRVTLHALHRALEPTRQPGEPPFYVIREGEFLRLNPQASFHIDADLFTSLIDRARQQIAERPELALGWLRQALALYQGEFLEECRYEEWAAPERERLLALYLNAAEQAARLLAERGAWEDVATLAQALLERDPYHEAACGLLVQAWWALGRRALALRTLERFRRRMRQDLGVEPSLSLPLLQAENPLS